MKRKDWNKHRRDDQRRTDTIKNGQFVTDKNGDLNDDPYCPYCREGEPSEADTYPMIQSTYNKAQCEDPDCPCSHIHLGCEEHPDSGLRAEYCKEHGTLTLICDECGGLVNSTFVASELKMVVAKHGPFLFSPEGTWKHDED